MNQKKPEEVLIEWRTRLKEVQRQMHDHDGIN
jgi:hypothetical protein